MEPATRLEPLRIGPGAENDAMRLLTEQAKTGFGTIAPDSIARLVVDVAGGAIDLDVGTAAIDALRRRRAFAVRDGLGVASSPDGKVRGIYTTLRSGEKARDDIRTRPYVTLFEGVRPIAGSCDCPDFTRSGLGACKHLLVVIETVFSDPRRLRRALEEQDAATPALRLRWDPSYPLHGTVDRLAGLRFDEPIEYARGRRTFSAWRTLFSDGRPDPQYLATLDDRRAFAAAIRRAFTPAGRARPEIDVTPAARAIISEEIERLERQRRCEGAAAAALPQLDTLERALYPFQRAGVERFLRSGRLLLADDMGLGKTTQAIAACQALFLAKKIRRGVVVVPAGAKPQWLREWRSTTSVEAQLVEGGSRARKKIYESFRSGFLILGYEQLLRDVDLVRKLAPEIVVLDEAQRIKNHATKTAETVKRLTPEYRLILSSTPMESSLDELASLLDWIDDLALAPKWRLEPWHIVRGDDGLEAPGAKHLDTLRARLSGAMLRRSRSEVLAELPARVDTRVPVEMTPQQRERHDELDEPIRKLVAISETRALTEPEFSKLMRLFTRQRVISNGIAQLDFEAMWPACANARPEGPLLEALLSPKLVELRRIVSDVVLNQGRKLVVFSQWRRMLRLAEWSLRDLLDGRGMRAVFFTGQETAATREENVRAFVETPGVPVMLLTDAGAIGLDLGEAATACVHLEPPWNPAVLERRAALVHTLGKKRSGEVRSIDIYRLIAEHGIESRIAELAASKKAFFAELFDGHSDELRFEGGASLPAGLARLVAPSERPITDQAPSAGDLDEIDTAADTLDGLAVADEIPPPPPTLRSPVSSAPGSIERPKESVPSPAFDLGSGIRVEKTADGGLRIDATPEAARALGGVLEGLAALLARANAPSERT